MTKKHFVAMATEFQSLLKSLYGTDARVGVVKTVEAFMRVAENVNPRFDRKRFSDACYGS